MPKASIINMLQLPGGATSQQVLLQVRFAEVNRDAMQRAGHLPLQSESESQYRGGGRPRSQFPAPRSPLESTNRRRQHRAADVQRLSEPVLLTRNRASAACCRRSKARQFSEPGRAEPDRLQRRRSQLSGRRRNPGSGRQGATGNVSGPVQGIRDPPDVHADHRGRCHPPEGHA